VSEGGWVFASSEESWTRFDGYASAEDAAAHAPVELDLAPGDTFYVGLAVRIDYADLLDCINGECFVQELQELAFEKWGWEDAFNEVTTPQGDDLEAAMRKAYTDWVARHAFKPAYFHIEHTRKMTVPEV
jgi:hypothetical protein